MTHDSFVRHMCVIVFDCVWGGRAVGGREEGGGVRVRVHVCMCECACTGVCVCVCVCVCVSYT